MHAVEYEAIVENTLQHAITLVKRHRSFNFYARLITPGGAITNVDVGGLASMSDFEKAKELYSNIIRKEIARLKAEAVLFVTDAYVVGPVDERAEKLLEITSMGLYEGLKYGITERRESVCVTLETRVGHMKMIVQPYKRDGKEIHLLKRRDLTGPAMSAFGYFAKLFEPLENQPTPEIR
jgi:hypothetical protein